MSSEDSDVTRLRQALYQHAWKEFGQILRTLLPKNVSQSTLIVTNQMARSCLRFQPRHNFGWVIRYADEITRYLRNIYSEHNRPDLPVEADEDFTGAAPGVANLVAGIEELGRSLDISLDANQKADQLVKALSEFVTGEVCHYWAIAHPEEWVLKDVFWNAKSDAEGKLLLPSDINHKKMDTGVLFQKQPDSVGYKVARWLSIVDEIEMTLGN